MTYEQILAYLEELRRQGKQPRLCRLKHDWQWLVDSVALKPIVSRMQDGQWNPGYNGEDYPAVVPLWTDPKGGEGAYKYQKDWARFLKASNPQYFVQLTRKAAGLVNPRGNDQDTFPANLDDYLGDVVAECIGACGNVYVVLEEKQGSVRLLLLDYDSAPPSIEELNYEDHPELVTCFTGVTEDGKVSKCVGKDVFFPNLGKSGSGWVPKERVEFFPQLPVDVTVTAANGLNVRDEPRVGDNLVRRLQTRQTITILEYALRGSSVWGRISTDPMQPEWVALVYRTPGSATQQPGEFTTWHMDTIPPLAPAVAAAPQEAAMEHIPGLEGKGMYLWRIQRVAGGHEGAAPPSPQAVVRKAKDAGLKHIEIKIVDADRPYNVEDGVDLAAAACEEAVAMAIEPIGWGYVYGRDPIKEADAAITRVKQLKLKIFVVNAEVEFKAPGMAKVADTYMQRLRAGLPGVLIGLSSYRYPSAHPEFPWEAFLKYCDFNMPQVYWVKNNNPAVQLRKSIAEFKALKVWRPIIPTGCAYPEGSWKPTPAQIVEFLDECKAQGLQGANFWEWYYAEKTIPELWPALSGYQWEDPEPVPVGVANGAGDPPASDAPLSEWQAFLRRMFWGFDWS